MAKRKKSPPIELPPGVREMDREELELLTDITRKLHGLIYGALLDNCDCEQCKVLRSFAKKFRKLWIK